jgi:hypothetical protein
MRSCLRDDRRRSFSDLDPPPASREHPGCDVAVRGKPVARTFRITPHAASLALRGLRAIVLAAAQTALHLGGAGPDAVLAELAGALRDLAAWWREAAGDRGKAQAKGMMR